ncbi:MAG: Bax inhibitor-1/YccA family protein [Proteobacteria bacterium]|nr:Bax inhibitor-1/YccA family protein [Pseudomonadota bacterium]
MSEFMKRNTSVRAQAVDTGYDVGLRAYMLQVFNYMGAALAISGVTAFATASSEALMQAIFGTPLAWVVMLAPIGFVMFFGMKIQTMTVQTARTTFFAFAVMMGLSLATLFVAYTGHSIARVFFITASVFGAMSLYGYTTKKDLTGMGSFLIMGLIGILIASLVNIFMKSTGLEFAISFLGVLIFTGLTAFDVQRIKNTYDFVSSDHVGKAAIMGALTLYMDFINLFLMLMKFFGDRR